jgi:DNA processing protein
MQAPSIESLRHELALSLIPKIGPAVYRNILAHAGSVREFFDWKFGKASKVNRVNRSLWEALQNKETYLKKADDIIFSTEKKGIAILTLASPSFPKRLKTVEDAPMVLYVKGNIDLDPLRTISIVGTRNATDYGRSITRKIVEDLALYQPSIISGLAYGIDIEAHRASLTASIPTIGVLGSSVDQIYPTAHSSTAQAMLEKGGLISEYPPGSEMHPTNFPKRNRIIAGLSDAIIVVEAAQKGGALITAEIAYGYNKEVFAVPGNLLSPYSEGCNNLIQTLKAGIYTGPKVLEESLSWSKDNVTENRPTSKSLDISKYQGDEKKVLGFLIEKNELEIDQLALLSDISISTLAMILLNLEFEGVIKSLPGKKYKLS